ncbi:MAG: hypothetical protein QOK29_5207, partial [Rhodospirillaceae bacterium]|nr:hypothetical protein [Rhodospirillaceae bacterium]
IGIVDVVRAQDRFGGYTVEKNAKVHADIDNISMDQARRDVEAVIGREGSIDLGLGIWLVVAGGVVGTIGGLLDLAWVGQRRLAALNADTAAAD